MVKNTQLLTAGNAAVDDRRRSFRELSAKLEQLASVSDERTAGRAEALRARLDEFAANVILVGQVKAGKSALANVLAGSPGLLPSDVNPWTSVVTTMRINTKPPGDPDSGMQTKAEFTFFDRGEWDSLVVGGGRLGELADRAGASEEIQKVERQIEEMRLKTEKRLGKHFELLLGQKHSYGYVDTELMERYVSLGDFEDLEDMNDVSSSSGRFADITKSAELYLDVPEYAMPLQLCDTPGVNDTFMMREQITIRSLRGAELCVVVLSAHQALTTIDLALMRIISNLEKRQIILFVNRADELQDPAAQIPEIREGIVRTLRANKVEADIPIIFGSAKWAEAALTGDVGAMSAESAASLADYRASLEGLEGMDDAEATWRASGLPELLATVGERVSEGSAARLHEKVRRAARNLANEARAVIASGPGREECRDLPRLEGRDPAQVIREISDRHGEQVDALCDTLRADLLQRMEKAQGGFVKRATDSLIEHFQRHGEQGTWQYDPAGLRVLHRSAFLSFSRAVKVRTAKLYADAAGEVEALYLAVLGDRVPDFRIEPPEPPRVPPPVGLGKTLALDLQGTWWRRWWQKRRGFEASANEYAHLIRAETQSIITEIDRTQVSAVLDEIRSLYDGFMKEHVETIERLSGEDVDASEVGHIMGRDTENAAAVFSEILRDLEDKAA